MARKSVGKRIQQAREKDLEHIRALKLQLNAVEKSRKPDLSGLVPRAFLIQANERIALLERQLADEREYRREVLSDMMEERDHYKRKFREALAIMEEAREMGGFVPETEDLTRIQ